MADVLSIEAHPIWGRTIDDYPNMYTKEALSARIETPLDDTKRAFERGIAVETIQKICMLGDPNLNEYSRDSIIGYVRMEKLECILETASFAGELAGFALPRLVAGCIVLLSSVRPSPFRYEYGYLCFKIMAVALNACLFGQLARSDLPKIVNKTSPNDCISVLWNQYPMLLMKEYFARTSAIPTFRDVPPLQPWTSTLVEKPRFDALLAFLDADQKNFTIALKSTRSLGLLGLMRTLWLYIQTERTSMKKDDFLEKLILPFTRVYYRYRLVVPNIGVEPDSIGAVFSPSPDILQTCSKFIDLEDSRNIVEACSNRLKSHNSIELPECTGFFIFIAPLVVQGCEDLICDLFDASMQVLWNSLLTPEPAPCALPVTLMFTLLLFKNTAEYLEPSANDCPWILRFVNNMLHNRVVDLFLRAVLTMSFSSDDIQGGYHPFHFGR